MDLVIRKTEGLYDELELTMQRSELDATLLSMPHAETLSSRYGIVRHPLPEVPEALRGEPCTFDPQQGENGTWLAHAKGLVPYKPAPVEHLRRLGLANEEGCPTRRVVAVGNRNLGNNWGVVAYHRDWKPSLFALKDEPLASRTYRCLVQRQTSGLSIEELRFLPEGGVESVAGRPSADDAIEWATFGNQVLANGRIRPITEMLHEFYDLRHVVCLSHKRDADQMEEIWNGYPDRYAERLAAAIRRGVPRSRYLHNCIAVADDRVGIIQKFGTPEELAETARARGFRDAVALDNGGSVFTYAWFARPAGAGSGPPSGGCVFSSADWRPPSISILCFVLHGPVWLDEPRGSVAFHIA
jgi:hypothetical protein